MAISPITLGSISLQLPLTFSPPQPSGLAPSLDSSFTQLVSEGLQAVDTKVARADALMQAFALGEPIPIHQVTIALEQARIAVELSVQVRERLTEAYRSFMSMQL